jgi:hypothetical protein
VIVFLIFAYYAWTWHSFTGFKAAIDTCGAAFCDFANFYYPMGESIFHTRLPLTGFVYSPFIAILLATFPPFGLHTALVLWGILQAVSIIFYLLLFRRLVPAGLPFQLLFVVLALSSFPLLHTLTWGQVSLFTTVAILGVLFFYERGQRVAAAALLAFGISFKFFPLIFFVPFIFRRDLRFLLIAAAACVAFLFVVPGILLGVDSTLGFYSALFDTYHHFDWVISNYNSQHFPHLLLRMAYARGYNALAFLLLLRGISYGIATLNVGLIYIIHRARLPHANLWSFHILFLSIPFVLNTSWPVDLVYISFAQGLLAWQLFDRERVALPGTAALAEKRISPARLISMLLLFVSILISNTIFFNLLNDRHNYGFYGFVFWADILLLITTYIAVLPAALRQIRSSSDDKLSRSEATSTRTVFINS